MDSEVISEQAGRHATQYHESGEEARPKGQEVLNAEKIHDLTG